MKKLWPILAVLSLSAIIWWSRAPLPKTSTIMPSPMNARPIVHSRIAESFGPPPKKTAPENRQYILSHAFITALKRDPPEGRSWESLRDEEFIAAVEEWSSDLTNHLGQNITGEDLAKIGLDLYSDLSSPYARYAAFSWAVRFGTLDKNEATKLLLKLSRDPVIQQSSEPEHNRDEDPEERVARLLGNAMIENYASNLKLIIGKERPKELSNKEESIGMTRIDALFDSID